MAVNRVLLGDDDDDCSDEHLGPSFKYHLLHGHAPKIYYIFWGVGAFSLIICAYNILPHAIELRRKAVQLRERKGNLFVDEAFNKGFWICLYPFVSAVMQMMCLLVPAWVYPLNLISAIYEAMSIYWFIHLIIYFMGGTKQSAFLRNIKEKPPTKHWSAFPLACCLRTCESEKYLSKIEFIALYWMTVQFVILNPLCQILDSMRDSRGSDKDSTHYARLIALVSLVTAVYGQFVLMRATANVLAMHNIRPKFSAIQSLFVFQNFPLLIMSFFNLVGKPNDDDHYSKEVMRYAWSATLTLGWCAIISFVYKRVYTMSDYKSAQYSYEHGHLYRTRTTASNSIYYDSGSTTINGGDLNAAIDQFDSHFLMGNSSESDQFGVSAIGTRIPAAAQHKLSLQEGILRPEEEFSDGLNRNLL